MRHMKPMLTSLLVCCACATVPTLVLPDPMASNPLAEAAVLTAWQADGGTPQAEEVARALERRHLPFSAYTFHAAALREGRLEAVEGLVRLQAQLDDRLLIPSVLARHYDAERWASLPASTLGRVRFLLAVHAERRGERDRAVELASAVPPGHPLYAKALYLQALTLTDLRMPGDVERNERALKLFERAYRLVDPGLEDAEATRGLAALALGRVSYGLGRSGDAVKWLAAAELIESAHDDTVFEGAWAKFQNADHPGALAQVARVDRARYPEASTLEALILYFDGQDPEPALRTLAASAAAVADIPQQLERAQGPGATMALTKRYGPFNRMTRSVVALCEQLDRERAAIASVAQWREPGLAAELTGALEPLGQLLTKSAARQVKERVAERYRDQGLFADNGVIITLEYASDRSQTLAQAEALKRIIPRLEDGSPQKAELLFRLAEVYRTHSEGLTERRESNVYLAEAVRLFDTLRREYRTYARMAEVLFNFGTALESLGTLRRALEAWETLVREFPASEFAAAARERLARYRETGR